MNVIIVEDDLIIADHLKTMLKKHGVDVVQIIDSVEEAIKFADHDIDLYIIDIRLNGIKTGIELGKHLNQLNKAFIYLTANNELPTIKNAVQTKPLTYITKPYKESDIIAILEIFKSNVNETITVKTTFGKKKIELSKLLYIKANGAYSHLVTSKKTYVERVSLNQYELELNLNFIRVHRSYIINKHHIDQFNSSFVYINNVKIPVSRSYKERFKIVLV